MKRKPGHRSPKKIKRDASKALTWLRTIAATKFDSYAERSFRESKLGTFGPASEVRRIDPSEYLKEKDKSNS